MFITGGTGFFGHWLLESLLEGNRERQLDIRITVLTRSVSRFRAQSPWIADDIAVDLLEGDICSFKHPECAYTHIMHAATDSGGLQGRMSESELYASMVGGTKHWLDFAKASGASRMLYVSSGAVYGSSIPLGVSEDFAAPTIEEANYAAAKQACERLCQLANGDLKVVVARCFAFVGPRLPLDQHFAIGNFIRAAMAGKTIEIRGDGTPWRSWLYMSDLATWLWELLIRGEAGRAYNVGSDVGYSISDAARLTAATLAPGLEVKIFGKPVPGAAADLYVPSIERARTELGLRVTVSLDDALRRTADWYRA